MSMDAPFEVEPVMVNGDIPCRKCGYNLRGLTVEGRCPECGTLVGVSVNGDLLRYSDPQYIQTLRRGVSLILWNIVLAFLMGIGVGILSIFDPRLASSPVFHVVELGASVIGVVGGWLLTEPDPSGIGEDQYGTARKFIRIALVIGAFNSVFDFIISMAGPIQPAIHIALQGAQLIVGIVGIAGQAAQLSYLSKLAQRLPDFALAERSRFLMWALPVSLGIIAVLAFLMVVVGRAAGRSGVMGFACVMGLAGLALLVFYLMYLRLLSRFGRAFDEQAAIARQAWARASE